MPARDIHSRNAISRAKWAVLQFGVITSAITLFGVYVFASRVDQTYLMDWYWWRFFAVGPFLIGLLCASGYVIGSLWSRLRVRSWLFAMVLVGQSAAYVTAHYAQFVTHGAMVWRDSRMPVTFPAFMRYTTALMDSEFESPRHSYRVACALRISEFVQFSLLALLCPLALIRRTPCPSCDGTTQSRPLGAIANAGTFPHLEHLSTLSPPDNARELLAILRPEDLGQAGQVPLTLIRCHVCGEGELRSSDGLLGPIELPPQLSNKLWGAPFPPQMPHIPPSSTANSPF